MHVHTGAQNKCQINVDAVEMMKIDMQSEHVQILR